MVPLLILLLALVLVVLPLWAFFRIVALGKRNEQLEQRLLALEREFHARRAAQKASTTADAAQETEPFPLTPPVLPPYPSFAPLAPPPAPSAAPAAAAAPEPLLTTPRVGPVPTAEKPPTRRRFDWEQFTGTKLLAWTGGAAAFLGAAFFIKYSFEHDLISPAMRVAIGYVFAWALVIAGLRIPRPRYAPTAQTLCATGIVCLYAVTFASSSIYSFGFFTPLRTFLLMALITAGAFVLAVRLGARVVAVLGMLGGFLTPILLSSGRDNAFGLFGYIALLDAGLVALALHQRWFFLVPLGAAGTVFMQLGWAVRFLAPARVPTAMTVGLVFCAVFLSAYVLARWRRPANAPLPANAEPADDESTSPSPSVPAQLAWPAIAMPCLAFLFALAFIAYPAIAAQPGRLFAFVFAADACLLTMAWLDRDRPHLHLLGGFAVFALLALWTSLRLTDALFPWALGLYLLHGTVHTTFPLLLQWRHPGIAGARVNQLFPALALGLMLVPFFKLDAVSFALWPCVLLIDLLAIGLAVIAGSLVAAATAMVLTLIATALWLYQPPPTGVNDAALLVVVGGFAALFFAGGMLMARRMANTDTEVRPWGDRRTQLPAFSVLMPFLLLIMMTQRLPLAGPAGVFGLAFLLVVLCLGLTRALTVPWLPACALAGVAALEYAWDLRHVPQSLRAGSFVWAVVFYLVFTAFPFAFRSRFAALIGPWAAAALAGVVHFPLVYRMVGRAHPNDFMGVLPALFAIAPLLSLRAIQRRPAGNERARLGQLAWFGGVALFFITLIVPIQFERQWITLGWALEGTALLWLFRRVPHPGLRATGVILLVAAFARLGLNPAVLAYPAPSGTPIFNWFLYSYGIVTACLFAGARLQPPGPARVFGINVRSLLYALGVVLAFLLLNIEIADFFTPPGSRVLTLQFSGHFGRDMTYTIAWALFALGLLLVSIWKQTKAGRYAALGLLGAAVLKLFVHDLERLGALHRIGALFAVAIIAIAASLAYQRFLPGDDSSTGERER